MYKFWYSARSCNNPPLNVERVEISWPQTLVVAGGYTKLMSLRNLSSPCCSREDDLKLLIIDSNGKKDNGEMNWRGKKAGKMTLNIHNNFYMSATFSILLLIDQ